MQDRLELHKHRSQFSLPHRSKLGAQLAEVFIQAEGHAPDVAAILPVIPYSILSIFSGSLVRCPRPLAWLFLSCSSSRYIGADEEIQEAILPFQAVG
jgi:hypothetical protein